jgi:hypothetical protein
MTDPISTDGGWRFDGLRALYLNCTLKRSPEVSQRSEWEAGCRFDYDNPDYR